MHTVTHKHACIKTQKNKNACKEKQDTTRLINYHHRCWIEKPPKEPIPKGSPIDP